MIAESFPPTTSGRGGQETPQPPPSLCPDVTAPPSPGRRLHQRARQHRPSLGNGPVSRSPSASRLGARLSGVKVTSMGPSRLSAVGGGKRREGGRGVRGGGPAERGGWREGGAEGRGGRDIPRAPACPPAHARHTHARAHTHTRAHSPPRRHSPAPAAAEKRPPPAQVRRLHGRSGGWATAARGGRGAGREWRAGRRRRARGSGAASYAASAERTGEAGSGAGAAAAPL